MKTPAERLAHALPPDAARAILAWIEGAQPGERIQVVLEKGAQGLSVTLPRRYAWHGESERA